jgi:histidinol phosphatase-like PHP family hydrolase
MASPRPPDDINALISSLLHDLASVQPTRQQTYGYSRAADAILWYPAVLAPAAALPKIPGVGPSSQRIIREVLEGGASATVEAAIDRSGKRDEIDRRRALRTHFLSRAAVLRILADPTLPGLRPEEYAGDFQMHSEWSDGKQTLDELAAACAARGYRHAAVTDHSYGLKIARGISMDQAADQRRELDRINQRYGERFRFLHGIEANIGPDGALDLTADEAARFDLVLAAPHSALRRTEDQTARLLTALDQPSVRILAHPRGRVVGTRGGLVAQWDQVFAAAARRGIAVEIDGDPARQDLDFTLARRALEVGCLIAVDSDAHTTGQLAYAEIAIAHARLAGIPADRIVNCWPLDRLLAWLADPARERARAAR